jgi:NADP-dependent 3-hydroxy acid dehydrogenase YdfG
MVAGVATGAEQADGSTAAETTFDVVHVADAVRYIANLPLEANVPFMTVMANRMPLLGRG